MSNELTKAGLPTELTAITETALEAYQNAKLQGSNTFDAWLVSKQYLITDEATKHYQWLLSSEPLKDKTFSKALDFSFKSLFSFAGQQNSAAKNTVAVDASEMPSNNPEDRPVNIEDCFYMMDKLVFKALDSAQAPVKNAIEEIKLIRNFINNNIQDEKLTIDTNKFLNHLHHDYDNIEQAITKEHLQEYAALRKDAISMMSLKNVDMHDQELITNALSKIIEGDSQEACDIINNQLHNVISNEAFHELIPIN